MVDLPFQTSVTRLLHAIESGQGEASNLLMEKVYEELRSMAHAQMRATPPGHTIQATALVHEAWVRLEKGAPGGWESRAHFFGAAAIAMRNILVDQARKKQAQKRGAGMVREALSSRIEAPADLDHVDMIALDQALESFSIAHERPARIVMLRCFAGADLSEIAKMLNVSESTVDRDWLFARTWLRRALDAT